MMYLNMQIIWTGVTIAFYTGILTPLMMLQMENLDVSYEHKQSKALYAMVFLGFGEVTGAQLNGLIIDWMGSMKTTLINILIVIITGLITVYNLYKLEMTTWTYVMTFAWGFSDGAINCHINQILGFEFESQSEPFCVFNFLQGIGVFMF